MLTTINLFNRAVIRHARANLDVNKEVLTKIRVRDDKHIKQSLRRPIEKQSKTKFRIIDTEQNNKLLFGEPTDKPINKSIFNRHIGSGIPIMPCV